MVLSKLGASPPRTRRRRFGLGGLAMTIIICLAGIGARQLSDHPLPQGVISYTPLEYSVSGLYADRKHRTILAIYGGGLPLPHGHHFVVIDTDSGKVAHDADLGTHMPSAMAVDGNEGHALIVFSDSNLAKLIDTSSGRSIRDLPLPFQPFGAAFDQDNGYAVVSGMLSSRKVHMVAVVDLHSGSVVRTVVLQARGQGYGVGTPVFDSAAHRIIIAAPGGVNILDSHRVRPIRFTPLPTGDPDKIIVDDQAHKAYVTLLNFPAPGCPAGYHTCARTVGAYAVVDDRDGTVLSPRVMVPGTTAIGAIDLSSQLKQLFIGDYGLFGTARDDRIYIMDARTGRGLTPIMSTGHPTTIIVDDRATAMIAGGHDGMDVFDTRTHRVLAHVHLPVERIWGTNGQGNLVVSNDTNNDTYPARTARTGQTGGGLFNQIAHFFRAAETTAGLYRRMNSGVSVVHIDNKG